MAVRPGCAITFLVSLSVGCTGKLSTPAEESPIREVVPIEAQLCGDSPVTLLPRRLRRLTRREYLASVTSLLGEESPPPAGIVPDPVSNGYDNDADSLVVTRQLGDQLFAAAEHYSVRALSNLPRWTDCDPSMPDEACALAFIDRFAGEAYRRPLGDAERDRLLTVYRSGEEGSLASGLELVIQAVLMSPAFLYRTELGAETAGDVALTSHEVAALLSYMVAGGPPDAELRSAADEGRLDSPDEREAQVRRLFASGIGHQQGWVRQWIGIRDLESVSKDPSTYPEFSPELRASMAHDLDAFIQHTVTEHEGSHREFMTSPIAFADATLAPILGLESTDPSTPVMFADGEQRAGLLTRPAVLSRYAHPNESAPILRGVFVLRRLLCVELPDPPPDAEMDVEPPAPGLSTRERIDAHTSNDACRGCHSRIDPIGFGFEQYDGIGRFRTEDQGVAVDALGEVIGIEGLTGPFSGGSELGVRLAESEAAQRCFVREAVRYARGRHPEDGTEGCDYAPIFDTVPDGDPTMLEVLVALSRSEDFFRRTTTAAGGGQ
ncbi:MAG: DUF1588 domain-containing protein [Myxococcota bacterium]